VQQKLRAQSERDLLFEFFGVHVIGEKASGARL
jgi:hypothetical protein